MRKNSDHLTLKLGCTGSCIRRCAATLCLKLVPSSPSADTTSDGNFTSEVYSTRFFHLSSPSLCATCVWLYRLVRGVFSNEPGFVGRHKCVWVTPFRDAPLFMTIPNFRINQREHPLGMGQRMPEWFWKTKAKTIGSSCPAFIWFEKAFWIVYQWDSRNCSRSFNSNAEASKTGDCLFF